MKNPRNFGPMDQKKMMQEAYHFTRPPRLEGGAKNAMMNPIKKKKKGK